MNREEFFRGHVHRRLNRNQFRCFNCPRFFRVERRSIVRVFGGRDFDYRCSECHETGNLMYLYRCGHHHCGDCVRA